MKSFIYIILLILSLVASSFGSAACVFNTDDPEVLDLIEFEDSNRVWEYLSKKPDCKIHRMFLGTFSKFNDTDVILFNYQEDPGFHGILKSSIAICKKDINSDLVICSRDM